LSADGRYVAFQSDSTNLMPGPASGFTDIYRRDTCLGVPVGCSPSTTRVSVANDGSLPNGNSRSPAISANGRYVAFDSSATNLFPGSTQTNGAADVFVRDTCIGAPAGCVPTTALVSVASDGSQPTGIYPQYGDSRGAAISSDGRFIAFASAATNLVPNDTNGWPDVFLRDTCIGVSTSCTPSTTRVSVANDGSQANAPSGLASISADGRYISFRMAGANNLIPNDPNASVILHDTCFGAASGCTPGSRNLFVDYAGNTPPKGGVDNLWILSRNARFSGFGAGGQNLSLVPGVPGDIVGAFVFDNCIGAPAGCIPHNEKASLTYNGGQPNNGSGAAVSSDDGNYVVFISIADNLLSYAYRSSAVYVRMTCKNAAPDCVPTTYLLSLDSSTGIQGNTSYSDYPAITPDGHYAVFISNAANWPGKLQSNGKDQVWLARVH
jgi:Tol biopolymer transport system component